MTTAGYTLVADGVLVFHALFVAWVVGMLPLVFIGGLRRWRWVRHQPLRGLHLVSIGYVALQAWFGLTCPLTVWEAALRSLAGEPSDGRDFVAHWLQAWLYWDLPGWVFSIVYTAFGLLVAASWLAVPPNRNPGF